MPQLLHLSASGVFSPLARRPTGHPHQIAGQPCVYLKKDLIHCGHYTHPAKGFNVPVDRKRIDDWVANFRKMRANGVKVPINLDHSDRAADCVGYVVEMSRSGDALNAVCQFIGADAAELAARNYVSVGIDPAYTDGQERDYGDAIVHVALTPVPIVPDQAPFALAATASPAVVVAPAAQSDTPEDKPIPMYKLTCHESTLRGLYRLVPGMEQAPHDQKIACLCRHLQMIARLDEKYGLAPARMDLMFDPDQPRDWRGRWTAVVGPVGPSTGGADSGTPGRAADAPATQPTYGSVTLDKLRKGDPPEGLAELQKVYEELRQPKIKNSKNELVDNPVAEKIKELETGKNKLTIRAADSNGAAADDSVTARRPGVGSGSTILLKTGPNATEHQDHESAGRHEKPAYEHGTRGISCMENRTWRIARESRWGRPRRHGCDQI